VSVAVSMVVFDLRDVFGVCRHSDNVCLPCNWVVDGFCGADGRVCKVVVKGV
jgi:hypothetical protein